MSEAKTADAAHQKRVEKYAEEGRIQISKCVSSIEGDQFTVRHGEAIVYQESRFVGDYD